MECNTANDLMMKYMDGVLAKEEKISLHEHLDTCAECAADFAAYSELLQGFGDMEFIEAPEGFEQAIMAQVAAIDIYPPISEPKAKVVDIAVFGLFGTFAAVLSAVVGLTIYRHEAYIALVDNGWYGAAGVISAITFTIANFVEAVLYNLSTALAAVSQSVTLNHWWLLVIFAVLAVLQFSISPLHLNRGKSK